VCRRFARRLPEYRKFAIVQREMSGKLLQGVAARRRRFSSIFEIGCGAGILSEKLAANLSYDTLYLNDIVPECADLAQFLPNAEFVAGDADFLTLPPALDLVVSNAALQWVEHLETLFGKVRNSLAPGGIFAFSSFAPGNLPEVAALTGQTLKYAGVEELTSSGNNCFKRVEIAVETRQIIFPSAREVLAHLRSTGVNAVAQARWSRGDLEKFCRDYHEHFGAAGGGVKLTFKPLYFYSESVK